MSAVAEFQPRARIIECSEAEYFADPCAVPSLSQSIAHTLITKSPLHAWTEHPRFGNWKDEGGDDKDKEAQKIGKVIHKLMLGKGAEIVRVPYDNFRTRAAQALRDESTASGKVPMLESKYADIVASVETLKANLNRDFGIDLTDPSGESEVAFEWEEDGQHGPILCRGRMDRVHVNSGLIIDVKKIRSAHPEMCGKHASEYGYSIQDAAYRSCLERFRPELAGRIQMLFVFMEVDPPYAITAGPLDGELRELGRQQWERALFLWEDCVRRDNWPGYASRLTPIQAPGWAMKRWMEAAANW